MLEGRGTVVAALALAAAGLGADCGLAPEPPGLQCASASRITTLSGVHYEGADCEAAVAAAESRPQSAHYRKACEQLAPSAGLPSPATDVYVASCRPAGEELGGSLLDVEVCCPQPPSSAGR